MLMCRQSELDDLEGDIRNNAAIMYKRTSVYVQVHVVAVEYML